MSDSYKIVTFKATDLPETFHGFVYKEFRLSLKHGNRLFKLWYAPAYYRLYPRYINALAYRPNTVIKIAVLSDAPDVALGWAMIETHTLQTGETLRCIHYCFVPAMYRKKGVAKFLLAEPFERFSHLTNLATMLWNSKFKNAKFNPSFPEGEEDDRH